jgi:hypothetical protein
MALKRATPERRKTNCAACGAIVVTRAKTDPVYCNECQYAHGLDSKNTLRTCYRCQFIDTCRAVLFQTPIVPLPCFTDSKYYPLFIAAYGGGEGKEQDEQQQ